VNGKLEPRSAKVDGIKASGTGDNTRDRCTELIYDGLACDSGAREFILDFGFTTRLSLTLKIASELILSRAKAVEAAVFAQFGSASAAYKGKIRSSYVNLKDKGNPSLRENIVSGDLSAEKFSKMTSEVYQA
jgi:transcription elongation factor S-II